MSQSTAISICASARSLTISIMISFSPFTSNFSVSSCTFSIVSPLIMYCPFALIPSPLVTIFPTVFFVFCVLIAPIRLKPTKRRLKFKIYDDRRSKRLQIQSFVYD
ncbi:Hypothetical_protein [Hexamita inflata]|uniref:Hypothetical_protein n=1 Tax=Hexamita inflata TaxID=28002 RepID=A0AA86N764_9EUKA|nr:Hypothetical protein HINF_LOCUS1947 [Hexamita inflata]CAI9934670.1 Hypothetical protein HINF_LOCUS22315 [Hexamita inflata]